MCCDLEVDVNDEQTFLVDKKVLTSFSGRLSKLFGKLTGSTRKLKVIFPDFPGGVEGFELIVRFCYNNGRIDMSPSNIFLLSCAANFMEMNKDSSNMPNLVGQIEKYLDGINYWTWSDFLVGLKQCQNLLPFMSSSCILHDFLKLFVVKHDFHTVSSPSTSSSNISSPQISFDVNADSIRNQCSRTTWWFEDLVFMNINLFEMVIKTMISHELDHTMICSFLFYYQKSSSLGASPLQKCKITETLINLLSMLDGSCISCRGLFHIFRVSSSMEKLSRCCKNKLENLIGSRLDQATLDDLLVPPPRHQSCMYDVNLILRFQKSFLLKSSNRFFLYRLKKVAALMDLYMAEVAPDPGLRPSKFVALVTALPDFGRDFFDQIYQALDMYLEVHCSLCEEEKITLCSSLNYGKLSPETLKHLAQNSNFPESMVVTAIVSRKSKLESLLQDTLHLKTLSDSLLHYNKKGNEVKNGDAEEILLYVNTLGLSTENEKQIGAHIQGMQWGVMELKKVCRKMQPQMANTMQPTKM
ncbi:BTB/POZ domain-containing protein At3g22104-like [Cornus florida]|uniref:BTB/POZ domain-containing protein At3g22104-like n=1 Tax=Cornus florida TaxID=4283 RepID=UPI002896EF9B|nr:BTB/POZ domain-containing protein At3g22104-like [Cornus florida]